MGIAASGRLRVHGRSSVSAPGAAIPSQSPLLGGRAELGGVARSRYARLIRPTPFWSVTGLPGGSLQAAAQRSPAARRGDSADAELGVREGRWLYSAGASA